MSIINEIREGFASLKVNNMINIDKLPSMYPAYVIRISDGYGVAVEVDFDVNVAEKFNSCKLFTSILGIGGINRNYLILISAFEEYRNQFASFCAEFVDPGENGKNREELIRNPQLWWKQWKELIGNFNKDVKVYSVIAELLVLEQKLKEGKKARWSASNKGTHDIECDEESCEVKATVKRNGAEITISSQHQLKSVAKLFLYFCRMEESILGVSVNDLKERLIRCGYDKGALELELQKLGFEEAASIRNKKYKVLEKRKYEVDDSFPRIVEESFKENKFPRGIVHLEYTVDLEGIKFTSW